MNFSLLRSILFLGLLATLTAAGFAQDQAGRIFDSETMVYEGRISRLKISVSMAELRFTATAPPSSNELVIKTDAVSKGTLLKLFRFSFSQKYVSTLDLDNFRIAKTTKRDQQKERVRESEALFDYSDRSVTWIETDPKDRNRPPRRIASDLTGATHDIISAIYAVRLQQLTVGKRFDLLVSDSGLVYKLPIVVTRREQVGGVLGKQWCFKIEPEIFGRGRLIEQKGKMEIWLTEDARRIPVKAQIDSKFGQIEIKLKDYQRTAVIAPN